MRRNCFRARNFVSGRVAASYAELGPASSFLSTPLSVLPCSDTSVSYKLSIRYTYHNKDNTEENSPWPCFYYVKNVNTMSENVTILPASSK